MNFLGFALPVICLCVIAPSGALPPVRVNVTPVYNPLVKEENVLWTISGDSTAEGWLTGTCQVDATKLAKNEGLVVAIESDKRIEVDFDWFSMEIKNQPPLQ